MISSTEYYVLHETYQCYLDISLEDQWVVWTSPVQSNIPRSVRKPRRLQDIPSRFEHTLLRLMSTCENRKPLVSTWHHADGRVLHQCHSCWLLHSRLLAWFGRCRLMLASISTCLSHWWGHNNHALVVFSKSVIRFMIVVSSRSTQVIDLP